MTFFIINKILLEKWKDITVRENSKGRKQYKGVRLQERWVRGRHSQYEEGKREAEFWGMIQPQSRLPQLTSSPSLLSKLCKSPFLLQSVSGSISGPDMCNSWHRPHHPVTVVQDLLEEHVLDNQRFSGPSACSLLHQLQCSPCVYNWGRRRS